MYTTDCSFIFFLLHGIIFVQAYNIDHASVHRINKRNANYVEGIDYVGIGYNLPYGNPDGSPTTAALDPGFKTTRRIFEWTFQDGRAVPDQINYLKTISCAKSKSVKIYHNAYAYSKKFDLDVTLSAKATFAFASIRFGHSSYYQQATNNFGSNAYVFYEESSYCNKGAARFIDELAQHGQYPLTASFVSSVNALPLTYTTHESTYMEFFDNFGTHVVSKVRLGTKEIKRYYWTSTEFSSFSAKQYSSSTSLGGSYKGYSASVRVDTNSVERQFDTETNTASYFESFTLGDDDLSLPYAYTLMSMDEIFDERFWTLSDMYVEKGLLSAKFIRNLNLMKSNMFKALDDYGDYLKSIEAVEDPIVIVPITWPLGTYGLPKAKSGCPRTTGFDFHSGVRYHDTEDDDNGNYWSNPNHFISDSLGRNLRQYFCMKTKNKVTDYDSNWPSGRYCVFQASNGQCPSGMEEGYIKWDDEDDDNDNSHSGSVPRGSYYYNTRIYYCCKTDGFSENAIYLPTDSSFYLFPYDHNCQTVEGMTVTQEYIRWDNEDDDNHDSVSGKYPYKNSGSNHKIYYCYYTPT